MGKAIYDAVLWLAEALRQRDPVAPCRSMSEIVMAAETARKNEKIVGGPGYGKDDP